MTATELPMTATELLTAAKKFAAAKRVERDKVQLECSEADLKYYTAKMAEDGDAANYAVVDMSSSESELNVAQAVCTTLDDLIRYMEQIVEGEET